MVLIDQNTGQPATEIEVVLQGQHLLNQRIHPTRIVLNTPFLVASYLTLKVKKEGDLWALSLDSADRLLKGTVITSLRGLVSSAVFCGAEKVTVVSIGRPYPTQKDKDLLAKLCLINQFGFFLSDYVILNDKEGDVRFFSFKEHHLL
ncbi:hypothetical protein [Motilimonas pumila]|uniref:Uncharacterized protein n=1 Tax=Motilimonas pumila TaxID=2303987 RepID=A0A418YA18_9GAMM|nr:hypothetical protein [Motilimonas pumila]RJG38774.1 hypothetical protein D1Z90_18695 [Motilimonas pumila]